ncbi:DUF2147 domain-containing protein [Haematobacter sp. UBA3484]|uniref:DUF2147 domain-containing protein n=2 Tax=unclassified Haematobacter TaxID=2640585 RepID=UPI0032E5111B
MEKSRWSRRSGKTADRRGEPEASPAGKACRAGWRAGWRTGLAVIGLSVMTGGAMTGGAAFAADPVQGAWLTQPDDNGHYGRVEIAPCGDRLCGTLTAAFGADGKSVPSDRIGKRIVWDMQPAGGGRYENGQIFAPDRGKTYASKMSMAGDKLTVSGCVLILCRSQVWSRAK